MAGFFLTLTNLIAEPSDEMLDLQYHARQIIAHKCWKCHGSERDEGDLRLHTRQHIMDSGTVDLANPQASRLLQRINLPEGHKKVMPSESKLPDDEIAVLTKWIEGGMQWDGRGAFKEAPLAPRYVPPIEGSPYVHRIDQHIDRYFEQNGIAWQPLVGDRIFLRRAYMDCIGLLPTKEEANAFISDSSPNKRRALVSELLSRKKSYQQHWQTFWNDLLRNAYTGTGFITGGRTRITDWLRSSLMSNKPYDIMVNELLSTNASSRGFIDGIKWRGTVSASQSTEMQAAQNSAQVFLGLNIKCASCHDAFTSNWSLMQSHQLAAYFSQSGSVPIHRCDKDTGKVATPKFLFDALGRDDDDASANKNEVQSKPENFQLKTDLTVNSAHYGLQDKPEQQIDVSQKIRKQIESGSYIISSNNRLVDSDSAPRKKNVLVIDMTYNGIHLKKIIRQNEKIDIVKVIQTEQRLMELGQLFTHRENGRFSRTIVNRYWSQLMGRGLVFQVDEMDGLPWSVDILDDLAYRFVEHGYDIKWLITEIMTSRAYQLPSVLSTSRKTLSKTDYIFKGPIVRRLTAEQFTDCFSQVVKPIYTHKGKVVRASDNPRDTFQAALGRPNRDNVVSMRSERGNLLESLELTNGTKLDSTLNEVAKEVYQQYGNDVIVYIADLFDRGLGRQATQRELELLVSIYNETKTSSGYYDIIWTFINLPEFQSIF